MRLTTPSASYLDQFPKFTGAVLPTAIRLDPCDATLLHVALPVLLPMAPVTHLFWSAHVAHRRTAFTRPDALQVFLVLTAIRRSAQHRACKLWDVALLGRDALLAWDRWLSFEAHTYPTQTVPHRLFRKLPLSIPGGLDTSTGRLWAHHPNLDAAFRPLYDLS